jgi:hypothetical protein
VAQCLIICGSVSHNLCSVVAQCLTICGSVGSQFVLSGGSVSHNLWLSVSQFVAQCLALVSQPERVVALKACLKPRGPILFSVRARRGLPNSPA